MKESVAFISNTNRLSRPYFDPSTRYRCYNLAQELSKRGYQTTCTTLKNFEANQYLFNKYDHLVFHRPTINENLAEYLITELPRRNAIADFDDLNFSIAHADMTPAVRSRGQKLLDVRRSISYTAEAASLFTKFTASTEPLANYLRRLFDPLKCVVINNGLEPGFVGLSEAIRRKVGVASRPYKYGYFSGTASHDRDIEIIAPALCAALDNDASARILFVGPVKVPEALVCYAHRVETLDIVPFNELPYLMASCENILAPLERNEFTLCKSGIKFFEAAVLGCNVIATPIPDIDRFQSPLLKKCQTPEDWMAALTQTENLEFYETESAKIAESTSIELQADKWESEFLDK